MSLWTDSSVYANAKGCVLVACGVSWHLVHMLQKLKCKKMECGIQDFPLESHLMATSLRPFNFDELGKHVIMWIIRFVGAHNLEVGWICTECNPYWYDWYCYQCRFSNWFLHWTPTGHYGQCGENCGCCRFREDAFLGPCGECLDLYAMSMTSCAMRGLILHYDGLWRLIIYIWASHWQQHHSAILG